MNITQNLVIKHSPSPYKSDQGKDYVLYIADYGPVGSKLNMDTGKTGKSFPVGADERFETAEEAMIIYHKFLEYVEDKIKQQTKLEEGETQKKKTGGRPSYHTWS